MKNGRDNLCKSCKSIQRRERYVALIEKGLCVTCARNRALEDNVRCHGCYSKGKDSWRRTYEERKKFSLCITCGIQIGEGVRCRKCQKVANERTKRIDQDIRDEAFAAYGGYECACCGETERAFLTLDHINNDGIEQRAKHGLGKNLFRWLRDNGFPPGLQVLCYNCNCGRARFDDKVCPHQR